MERDLDRLYQVPPGEFTAARDELAKRLRDDGDREQAEQVKKLRKPTAGVWLVNRLARERELDVQRLAKAGEALGKGSSSEEFANARDEEQRSLERLHQAARELAEREGIGAPSVERATQTLRAASLTDEGRRLLKQGRLTEELQPPGFEALTGMPAAAPRPPAKKKAEASDERKRALAEARETLRRLKAEERDLSAAARAAAREAERAEAEAGRRRREADDARAAADEAAQEVSRAEAGLDKLR